MDNGGNINKPNIFTTGANFTQNAGLIQQAGQVARKAAQTTGKSTDGAAANGTENVDSVDIQFKLQETSPTQKPADELEMPKESLEFIQDELPGWSLEQSCAAFHPDSDTGITLINHPQSNPEKAFVPTQSV